MVLLTVVSVVGGAGYIVYERVCIESVLNSFKGNQSHLIERMEKDVKKRDSGTISTHLPTETRLLQQSYAEDEYFQKTMKALEEHEAKLSQSLERNKVDEIKPK